MTASAELQQAIDSLKIRDVYLRGLDARCLGDFDPKYAPDLTELTIQQMHLVNQSQVVEIEGDRQLLRVFVRLGVRWMDSKDSSEEESIRALIEAEFITEYEMTKDLEKAAIDEFSLKNASYHVWPYWRELLSSQCSRMHLPRLILPTVQLAHNRHQKVEGSESASKVTEH
ncbi:MAG TPA: preprotein translocase subunit SecB [Thiolapillus brandeum]|uniref:Preprotein translocase subunit SecB n=1 Tax=Thiolapillus brandeum TaxID=1076588 RepID=A0A831WA93_9GAMM|nr:preprotein translocase subunit SecB [Thiolapillus brandeum]